MIRALDLLKEVIRSSQWEVPTTLEGTRRLNTEKAVQAVNYVGLMLGRYITWRFLFALDQIVTVAKHTTGGVRVTFDSDTVSGGATSPAFTPSMAGRAFKIDSYEELYRVKAFVSPTSIRIDPPYNGTTATSDLSYVIAQDRYPLPEDFDAESIFGEYLQGTSIRIVPPDQFDERRFGPSSHLLGASSALLTTQAPSYATIEVEYNGRQTLVLDPFPEGQAQIRFSYYRQLPELKRDDDSWPFPLFVKPVIHDGALHFLNRDIKKDLQSAQMQLQEFFSNRTELAGLTRRADAYPRFQPDTGLHRIKRFRSKGSFKGHTTWERT